MASNLPVPYVGNDPRSFLALPTKYAPPPPAPLPWGKIAFVALAGLGLIVGLRMLKKKRR